MPRRLGLAFCALAVAVGTALQAMAWAQEQVQPQQELPASPAMDAEGIARRQPLLLEGALAGLKASRPDEPPQLYFVAFAGYGPEAVFKREALAVRELFDTRFGTGGRSLVLVNHASTVDAVPLASQVNLDRALHRIGRLMRPEQDVLFLFLTSHGHIGQFAVAMPGFELGDLTPESLKAILDRSGIQNRVVVVSACHSGSFIPALAGPRTLVIASARADRTSFGCEDKRQWTYFGDAFFNRSLRREHSFERAFRRAERTIARWEAADRLEHSLPQMAGGKALRPRLEAIARRGTAR